MRLIAKESTKQDDGETGDAAGAGAGSSLAALLDEFAHAAIVTTVESRVLHANQAGRHELARGRILRLSDGVVQACRAESDTELHLALGRAVEGKRSLLQLEAPDGGGSAAAILPLKGHVGDRARVAIVLARPKVCDAYMLSFFGRRYGLTPAEQHVLGILCEGVSAPEIAVRLKVAVSTVRSHIRSLRTKTRCKGVRELVSRLAVLPPVTPAFPYEACK
jgi:DNA-binding CsgD family transcriptional regulator